MNQSHLDDIRGARTEDDLHSALIAVGNDLGFGIFTMTITEGPLDALKGGKTIHNVPTAWYEAAADLDSAMVDPVFLQVHRTREPFFYDQSFYVDAGAGPLWEESSAHGISSGVCASLDLPGDRHLFWGFDGDGALPTSERTRIQVLAATQLVGIIALGAAEKLLRADIPVLTDTQLAMLHFTRDGKSSWDISKILGMSVDTVNYHLKKCRAKLGVANKHQAVHKAVSLGLLR